MKASIARSISSNMQAISTRLRSNTGLSNFLFVSMLFSDFGFKFTACAVFFSNLEIVFSSSPCWMFKLKVQVVQTSGRGTGKVINITRTDGLDSIA